MTRRGVSMVELLGALAIAGLILAVAVPRLRAAERTLRRRGAVLEIVGTLRAARMQAVGFSKHVAVRFEQRDGTWGCAMYRDSNGNGVLTAEITSGVDKQIRPWTPLPPGLSISMPPFSIPDPVESGTLSPSASPVRWNSSHMCSFGPIGEATPGSLIFTVDSGAEVGSVVVSSGGHVRSLHFETGGWVKD